MNYVGWAILGMIGYSLVTLLVKLATPQRLVLKLFCARHCDCHRNDLRGKRFRCARCDARFAGTRFHHPQRLLGVRHGNCAHGGGRVAVSGFCRWRLPV
jgi:hypothetical protein